MGGFDACYISPPSRRRWWLVLGLLVGTKALGMVGGWYLAPRFLSSVGDHEAYVSGHHALDDMQNLDGLNSTAVVGTLSLIFGGGAISDYAFATLGAVGIWLVARYGAVNISLGKLLLAIALPSTMLWTSITGKEAIVVLALGAVFGSWMHAWVRDRWSLTSTLLCAGGVAVTMLFKPHYLLPLFGFWFVLYGGRWLGIAHGLIRFFLLLCMLLASMIAGWDAIVWFSEEIIRHFSFDANATRVPPWTDALGFVAYAPLGAIIALLGPTPSEVLQSLSIHYVIAGIEAAVIVAGFLWLWRDVLRTIPDTTVIWALIALLVLFAGVHYPFGILNPGSAIRYRSGFLPIIFLVLALIPILYHQRQLALWRHSAQRWLRGSSSLRSRAALALTPR